MIRVLKPGGEFYFADVYTDRRLPREIGSDPEVLGPRLIDGAWNSHVVPQ